MILITFDYKNGIFQKMEAKGHAESGPYGHDLVCAAVSGIVFGGMNNLSDAKSFESEVKEGFVRLEAKKALSSHDKVVIETMMTQLESLERSNKDHVRLERNDK